MQRPVCCGSLWCVLLGPLSTSGIFSILCWHRLMLCHSAIRRSACVGSQDGMLGDIVRILSPWYAEPGMCRIQADLTEEPKLDKDGLLRTPGTIEFFRLVNDDVSPSLHHTLCVVGLSC